MPNVKITDLPAAQPLTGTEIVPMVQGGVTVRATTAAIAASPSLTQTFLTLNQEPTLPNSRALTVGSGLGLTDAGALSTLQITLNGASGSLEVAGNGLVAKTSLGTVAARSIQSSGAGISVTNGSGVSGNPTVSLSGLAQSLANYSGTGFLVAQGGGNVGGAIVSGTANQIDVADSSGVLGGPIISISSNPILPGTGSFTVPKGTTAQRPVGVNGMIRYNSDDQVFELYTLGSWKNINTGGIALINTGSGLTGGPITTTGTISVDSTVARLDAVQTLTNKAISGISNTLSDIGNSSLTNSSVTFNGVTVDLGNSGTIPIITSNSVIFNDIGTGDSSGAAFDGAATVLVSYNTIGASPVAGSSSITTVGTVTSGTWNATPIDNSYLTNSSLTFNGVTVALGASGTITANTTNSLTFNNSGTGDASGAIFDGSAAKTISYNSIGASPLAGSSSITTVGTVTSGTWNATPIANNYLANSSLTIGTTSISLGSSSLTLGGLTSVEVTQNPASALQLATKQYVDAVAEGLHVHASCAAATTGTLASITGGSVTYNNGTAGVGATLTLGVALTSLDGYSLQNGDRILVKNEATQANNGIYTWATGGTVLTRATDFDTPAEIASGDFTFISNGTLYGDTGWVQTNNVAIVGTDPVTWIQFSGAGTYTAGTGLTLTGSQFSLTVPVTAALGGTGITSYATGDLLYASASTTISKLAIGTSTNILTSSGTAPQWTASSSVSVGSATDATNTAITDDTSTNATVYPTWVTANTGNLPQKVTSTKLFFNPSTGALTSTGGISGGTF